MTTVVETRADSRMQMLPSEIRIVRLGPGHDGWLHEYAETLRHQATDFLQRAGIPGDPDGVLSELVLSLDSPWRAVWLVLRPNYRLIGWAVAELRASFGQAPEVFAIAMYVYPKRVPREVFPALVSAILGWGRTHGASRGTFATTRTESRAWARIGAHPAATLYEIPMPEEGA
jgi:GNAT superfamily N-acetyltransferase